MHDTINGAMFKEMLLFGTVSIAQAQQAINDLNVFPVPDGDTGTNMSLTIQTAAQELKKIEPATVDQAASVTASALLRGARGNSGVILSLLFRGIAKELKGCKEADGAAFAAALQEGVAAAYNAVMKPAEGTILTVSRLAAERAVNAAEEHNSVEYVIEQAIAQGEITLAQTTDMNPVLKKAGVVDAGGKGFTVIFTAMLQVFKGGEVVKPAGGASAKPAQVKRTAVAEASGDIKFAYCTEYIVNKKKNADNPLKLRAYLESIGDCVVVVDDEDIIKVHVHSNHPGNAIEEALKFGMLTNLKIENMKEQHSAQVLEAEQLEEDDTYVPVDPQMPYGFVAVAAGAGMQALFQDLGVNSVVTGGQTMNPSTEDILKAIHATPAETVFVLPNNKNIIMAAEQAIKLADRRVCVLQTRTIPQGISAMLAFDPDKSFSENRVSMTKALDKVQTGQITFAARDSDFDGHNIKAGELLAMENGKLAFVDKDLNRVLVKLTKSMVRKDSSFVTVLYGADISDDQAAEAYELLRSKLSDNVEINLINGGQPVYYYIVSVE